MTPPLPALRTERLVVRPLRDADVAALFAWGRDPAIAEHVEFEPFATLAEARSLFEAALDAYASGWPAPYGIAWREAPGRVVGTIALWGSSAGSREVELGFTLAHEVWGRGVATEAGAAMRDAAFAELGAETLLARVKAENHASARVLEKLGLRPRPLEEGPRRFALSREAWVVSGFLDNRII